MSCCNDILDFGCIGACEVIMLPIIIADATDYKVEFSLFGVTITHEVEINVDGNVLINISEYDLNENTCIEFKIKKPDNTYLVYEFEGIEYECFKIKTILKYEKYN